MNISTAFLVLGTSYSPILAGLKGRKAHDFLTCHFEKRQFAVQPDDRFQHNLILVVAKQFYDFRGLPRVPFLKGLHLSLFIPGILLVNILLAVRQKVDNFPGSR